MKRPVIKEPKIALKTDVKYDILTFMQEEKKTPDKPKTRSKMEKQGIIALLKPYFDKENSIIFGFLFGSYSSGRQCLESDIDIAVYLKNENNELEGRIQNKVERLLGKEVDFVILNRASVTLAWEIIRKGFPLTIKDRGVYLDFMLEVSREAEDFIDFNLDAWRRKYANRKSG